MILTRTKNETEIMINGPAGKLEALLGEPTTEPKKIFGIVCHPHSLHGGSMDNKVVTTLVKTFQQCGLHTIRFNFRGVGKSEGRFDEGNGEYDDLLSVITWIQQEHAQHIFWLAGFSFGAFIAAKAATQLAIQKLVLVAPAVEHFPMKNISTFLCPWILVQGDQDEVVPAKKVYAWAKKVKPEATILTFKTATHFFHGQLTEMRHELEKVLAM